MPNKIVLLGDSIFDNAAYVRGGPDVLAQLRRRLPEGWAADLLAVDGSVMADIPRQVGRLPSDATRLVVSVGGNDALRAASALSRASRSVAESLAIVAEARRQFWDSYAGVIDRISRTGLPAAFCTVYDPRYPDPAQRTVTSTALATLNDCITREVFRAGLPLVDLRLTCDDDGDFANPIEPSVQGGGKIAAAIVSWLEEPEPGRPRTRVFV